MDKLMKKLSLCSNWNIYILDWFVHFFEFKCKLYPRLLLNFITVASLSNWTPFCLKFLLIFLLFLFFFPKSHSNVRIISIMFVIFTMQTLLSWSQIEQCIKLMRIKRMSQTKWNITWCYDNSDLILFCYSKALLA